MDPVKAFFQKYGAVPADDRGPQWELATTDALLTQLSYMTTGRDNHRAVPPNHKYIAPLLADMTAVAAELWKRVTALAEECGRQPADWPGRSETGRILAGLALAGRHLRVEAK
jgi:hypothetical protein